MELSHRLFNFEGPQGSKSGRVAFIRQYFGKRSYAQTA
jgi:hypothetical protein